MQTRKVVELCMVLVFFTSVFWMLALRPREFESVNIFRDSKRIDEIRIAHREPWSVDGDLAILLPKGLLAVTWRVDERRYCAILQNDPGENYLSFRTKPVSIDGSEHLTVILPATELK